MSFLGPRGPRGIPVFISPSARKIWITYIQAYMPHESSEDSSNQPNGPMGSPRRLPNPLGPPGPPMAPLGPQKRSLGLIEL